MKLNKVIEEEALRYVCKILKDTDYKDAEIHLEYAFRDGANFILSKWQDALRWRKVEEELPKQNEYVLIRYYDTIIHAQFRGGWMGVRKYWSFFAGREYFNLDHDKDIIKEWLPIPRED